MTYLSISIGTSSSRISRRSAPRNDIWKDVYFLSLESQYRNSKSVIPNPPEADEESFQLLQAEKIPPERQKMCKENLQKTVGDLITGKIEEISSQFEKKLILFKEEIKEEFSHQLGIQTESVHHKLDLVVEGHQMLSEKIDSVKTELEQKISCVEGKLDAVAADISAHRADSEAHDKVYKVKED